MTLLASSTPPSELREASTKRSLGTPYNVESCLIFSLSSV